MDNTRRNFLKKAGYAAPAVLTMTTMPAMASFGSNETGGSIDPEIAQPARWQTRARRNELRRLEESGVEVDRFDLSSLDKWQSRETRNRLRRLEESGIDVNRFSDWESIDPSDWTS